MRSILPLLSLLCLLVPSSATQAGAADQRGLSLIERTYLATSETTKLVAEPYFSAYIARDWTTLGELLHDEGSWRDPTAEQLFGVSRPKGKVKTLSYLRKSFAGIEQMQAQVTRSVFSSHYAVFEASLDWSVAMEGGKVLRNRATPLVVVLRIQDGKVIEHTDYAEYRGFVAELHRLRGK